MHKKTKTAEDIAALKGKVGFCITSRCDDVDPECGLKNLNR